VVAGFRPAPDLEHEAGQPGELELAVVGVPAAGVAQPAQRHVAAAAGGEQLTLDSASWHVARGAELEAAAAADHVERQRVAQPARPALAPDVLDEAARAEVVGLTRVGALLGAGGDEPDVAERPDRAQPRRQRDDDAHAGRVVHGPGSGGDAVGVGHHDLQAAARAVVGADDVLRPPAPAPGHPEAGVGRRQPGALEAVRDVAVGAELGAAGGGPRADLARQVHRRAVRGVVARPPLARKPRRGERDRCREHRDAGLRSHEDAR
jgi:hypothetical protein